MPRKKLAEPWTNRIVDHGEVDPATIAAHPRNWRAHPKAQAAALLGAIHDVGVVRSVTINRRTGFLVDGHLRVALAIQEGQASIPVEYVDLSEAEELEALATLDPIGALATADREKLDELLRDVQSGEAAVQAMLAEIAEADVFGDTSTDRKGQGVGSTWDQVKGTDNQRVIIGDLETRLPADVVQMLTECLDRTFERERRPIYETLEAIVVAGVRAVEAGSDRRELQSS